MWPRYISTILFFASLLKRLFEVHSFFSIEKRGSAKDYIVRFCVEASSVCILGPLKSCKFINTGFVVCTLFSVMDRKLRIYLGS